MFRLSDKAAAVLHQELDANESGDESVFRLSQSGDSLEMNVTEAHAGDRVFRHEERDVLAVASDVDTLFDRAMLDVVEMDGGVRLVIQSPEEDA
jgi:hypothetical protein